MYGANKHGNELQMWLRTGSCKRKADENSDSTGKVVESQDAGPTPAVSSKQTPVPSRHEREKSTVKVKRRYHSAYIEFGVFWTGDKEDPKPHCVLCYETLANEAMKPAKLKHIWKLNTKRKPTGFFERKCDKLTQHMMKEASQFFAPGENAKATEAAYKVSLLIAKAGKPHSIGENFVKPAAKVMANILFWGGKPAIKITGFLFPLTSSSGASNLWLKAWKISW